VSVSCWDKARPTRDFPGISFYLFYPNCNAMLPHRDGFSLVIAAFIQTRQAANRYIENLAIASAWPDMQQDSICKGGCTAEKSGGDDALPLMSGRQFTIS
jgi:hypothetical protein